MNQIIQETLLQTYQLKFKERKTKCLNRKLQLYVVQQHHGKTALSIELAKAINGEIVSADSMQIYKYMDIGSAKPTKEEMQGITHYMIDILEPNKRYSVAEYKKQATECIKKILKNGKVPIVVGGTRIIHKFPNL